MSAKTFEPAWIIIAGKAIPINLPAPLAFAGSRSATPDTPSLDYGMNTSGTRFPQYSNDRDPNRPPVDLDSCVTVQEHDDAPNLPSRTLTADDQRAEDELTGADNVWMKCTKCGTMVPVVEVDGEGRGLCCTRG